MVSLSALTTCVKYLLFLFNLIFVITGIIVIAVGAAVQAEFNGYEEVLSDSFIHTPALMIAIGVLIFLIAFFGCCGAIKENYCMILSFSILMILIFILELAAGIAGFVLRDQTYNIIQGNMKDSMQAYNKTVSVAIFWDELQTDFKCCGTDKSQDWEMIFESTLLPMSCCQAQPGQVGISSCNSTTTSLFKTGCVNGLANFLSSHAASIGAAGVCIGIIQFIGIMFSCHLARRTKYENVA